MQQLEDRAELKVVIKGRALVAREALVKVRTSRWDMVMIKAWKDETVGVTLVEGVGVGGIGNK
jgi:hypothetical protein